MTEARVSVILIRKVAPGDCGHPAKESGMGTHTRTALIAAHHSSLADRFTEPICQQGSKRKQANNSTRRLGSPSKQLHNSVNTLRSLPIKTTSSSHNWPLNTSHHSSNSSPSTSSFQSPPLRSPSHHNPFTHSFSFISIPDLWNFLADALLADRIFNEQYDRF